MPSPVAAATSRSISTDLSTWSAQYTLPCHKYYLRRSNLSHTGSRSGESFSSSLVLSDKP